MPKEKASNKINAAIIITLLLSTFFFSMVFANSIVTAQSSFNPLQQSATVRVIGSISHPVYLGAWLELMPGGYNRWVTETGMGLAIYASFATFAPQIPVPDNGSFYATLTDRLQDSLPMLQQGLYGAACITWMTSYSVLDADTGPTGSGFQCTQEVANGTWDNVIVANAIWIKNNFPYPLILRIDQEFNLPNSWGWGKNSTIYVAAYQRIVDIFRQENVSNVEWSWCPNFDSGPGVRFADYYPGDSYVDWVGADVYANTWGWRNFDEMLNATNSLNPVSPYEFALAHNKPFMIGEWGLNITGDMSDAQSAVWMQGMFDAIATRTNIRMMIHWSAFNWCLLNYPEALQVYKSNIASPEFSAQYP